MTTTMHQPPCTDGGYCGGPHCPPAEPIDLLTSIGARFQELRKANGASQEEVASRVGLTRSSIANFEAGRQDVPLTRVVGMCSAISVTVQTLIGDQPSDSMTEKAGALRLRARGLADRVEVLMAENERLLKEIERLARIADRRETPGASGEVNTVSDETTYLDVSVIVPGLSGDDLDRAADVFHDADIDGSLGATLTTGEVRFSIPPGDGAAALVVLAAINELYGKVTQ